MTRAPEAVRRWVDIGLSGLLVVAVATMFLSWARSGSSSRSSFELFRSADRLGLLDGAWAQVGVVIWLALPFVAGAAVVALASGRRRVGAALAGGVGCGLLAGVWMVKVGPLPADGGMTVALVVGVLIVAMAAAGSFRFASRSLPPGPQTPEPDKATDRHDNP
ncbi:MAG: hypothetical protein GY929_23850 [Actinomycetia bacterium]|nr:hypothetical protein [Actinomycetes bacterium]